MDSKLPNKIPLKVLLKLTGRLFLLFLLGALLITSLQDWSLTGLIQRTISLGTLFIIIFGINTIVFHYFDKRRKDNLEKIWLKTFIVGYFISFIYFYIHTLVILWLMQNGWYEFPENHIKFTELSGLRYHTFVIGSSFIIYTFIFLVQNTVLTQYENNRIQMELLQLEASNSDAINQLLRQQIQPHFLFNALNILKSLIKKDAGRAEEYLLHLSDFLRASVTKNTSGISTVEEELKICHDYMEMQQIRFGTALQYEVNLPHLNEIKTKKLPFFSLQSLLENAIKHNSLTPNAPLQITISEQDGYIKVSNNLQLRSIPKETSTGNGLSMLFERYRILNEDSPLVEKDDQYFSVLLKVLN